MTQAALPSMPPVSRPKFQPTPAQLDAFAEAVKPRFGPWWSLRRVKSQRQVNFICAQAAHFGSQSQAARFLERCEVAGVIVRGAFARQPGQDFDDEASA